MNEELPKGFTCECGKYHKFTSYVYSHWGEELKHTCSGCKRRHFILEGLVTTEEE